MLVGPYGVQCQGSVFSVSIVQRIAGLVKWRLMLIKQVLWYSAIKEHSGINEAGRARSLQWYWSILQKQPRLTKSYQQL